MTRVGSDDLPIEASAGSRTQTLEDFGHMLQSLRKTATRLQELRLAHLLGLAEAEIERLRNAED